MDAFSYLSVLLSIILGLAVQQVLQGYRALILSRRRIIFYAPPLIWSVLILAMVAQHWWASFGLAGRAEWSFGLFATILIMTALIYMMAAIVLPDVPADEKLDLRDHYYREAPAFFGLGAATVGWSLFREYMLTGALPEPANLGFHLAWIAMSLTAALTKWQRLHEALALLMTVLFATYIALLFARL
jgi:hypothetical protein